MGNTLTIRLPDDLAQWLEETSRKSGIPRGRIVKMELERAQKDSSRPFMRLAGAVDGAPKLSLRKGFSRT
jgi:predicted transcriptional regulator